MSDEELVWVPRRTNGNQNVYHTDADCPYVKEASRQRPRRVLNTDIYRECRWCSGEWPDKAAVEQRTPLRTQLEAGYLEGEFEEDDDE